MEGMQSIKKCQRRTELFTVQKYMNAGINAIESTEILKLDPFVKFGKPAKIASFFGGPKGYYAAVEEMEKMLYEAS